jgi:hypothetical protein
MKITKGHLLAAPAFAIFLLFTLAGCSETADEESPSSVRQSADDTDAKMATDEARAAISTFAAALKTELVSAMQQGGPLNAIEVCHTNARAISEQVSAEQGLRLGRVSLRNRNPLNAPLDWQVPVLDSFERRVKEGESPDALDWSVVATVNGSSEFRYMKAIPTAGLCLQCHGTAISPEVSGVLNELYPQDKATGYQAGDIRGAFVVTKNL